MFIDNPTQTTPLRISVMRQSTTFPIDAVVVGDCLDPASATGSLFARAWRSGPASLTRAEKCAVAGATGHIAESVTEVLLDRQSGESFGISPALDGTVSTWCSSHPTTRSLR